MYDDSTKPLSLNDSPQYTEMGKAVELEADEQVEHSNDFDASLSEIDSHDDLYLSDFEEIDLDSDSEEPYKRQMHRYKTFPGPSGQKHLHLNH